MRDRLLKLIEKERISSAEFADRLGVQRSNVSHILNGRNNPGFSFIQKVLETFPKVDPRWLITGEGSIESNYASKLSNTAEKDLDVRRETNNPVSRNLFSAAIENTEPVGYKYEEAKEKNIPVTKDNNEPSVQYAASRVKTTSKRIIRALLFYDDNTFDDFSPTDKM